MSDLISKVEKYIHDSAYTATLAKGRALLRKAVLQSVEPQGKGVARYKVASENYHNQNYNVKITGFKEGKIDSVCDCPYDYGGLCKHEVAALIQFIDYLQDHPIGGETKKYSMLDSLADMKTLSDEHLKENTTKEIWNGRGSVRKVGIVSAKDSVAECVVTYKKAPYTVRLAKDLKSGKIHTSCSCNQELTVPLCEHKVASLLALREIYGVRAFDMFKDLTAEKNELLQEYGFTVEDKVDDKFEFKVNDKGKLKITPKDPSLMRLKDIQKWKDTQVSSSALPIIEKPVLETEVVREMMYVLLPNKAGFDYSDVFVKPYTYQENPKTGKITYLRAFEGYQAGDDKLPVIDEDVRRIFVLKERLDNAWLVKTAHNRNPEFLFNTYGWDSLGQESQRAIQEVIGQQLDLLFPLLAGKPVYIPTVAPNYYGYHISSVNDLRKVSIALQPIRPVFYLKEDDTFVIVEGMVEIEHKMFSLALFKDTPFFWLLEHWSKIYKWKDVDAALTVRFFRSTGGKVKVRKSNFEGFFTDFILPLTEKFEVDFQIDRPIVTQPLTWKEGRIYLKEDENNLMIVPLYAYTHNSEEMEFGQDDKISKVHYDNDAIQILERNPGEERNVYEFLKSQHPDFAFQQMYPFFYIPFKDVLKDQWLFRFFEAVREKNLRVFGFSELKKLKYNPHRADFQIRTSSGIDWFDMQIEVRFGDQFVSLDAIRKALLKKQNYVELKDGSLGLLPEEWIEKHAQLFRLGNVKDDSIRISKLHFNLIDDLFSQIDDVAIQQELYDKKQKLVNFKEIPNLPVPAHVNAELRHYQKEGYKWMCFLDEFGWGGCLADDMGLGKTLQVLTFLQEQKNRHPNEVSLVVMPTTLIFNWQAEAERFCPTLKLFIHRGNIRQKEVNKFTEYDVILTTYGTLRNDIEWLKDFQFHYVVLDESQAIKNTTSLISKAVKLLKAKNRLVMTGTPVENNTFDLYSQFDFLNPGFLGSEEYFKTEFANAIDKHQDKEKTAQLRKMIYPFMLKRTKEEVAKDLPDKTETILFCEMDKKQRKVYDTFREIYRQKIEEKMKLDGPSGSSMLILEGLLKLRQICDSPALLSDEGEYPENSAKLDEIVREIEENASNHKILIFSQFIKMLQLIRTHLEDNEIQYEYLDGSTQDRAARVRHFQSDPECRVFLISLKAGGVGINLTEADYVYLVDPWWNPAVEAQAIDRTHRIGQTKKVFAYKMICKDTIEEKILALQSRKKELASDLIDAEAGFIKKLTQEDIIDLFS